MQSNITKKQGGFTILELVISSAVFAVALLLVTAGIIRIGQIYYKGRISAKTQEVTRTVGDNITETIQLAGGQKLEGGWPSPPLDPSVPQTKGQFCFNNTRFTYNKNKQVTTYANPADAVLNENVGLMTETIQPDQACNDQSIGTNKTEQLATNMRLLDFKVEPQPTGQLQTWKVIVKVAYGDNDLLSHYNNDSTPVNPASVDADAANANCKSGIAGSSFCATSTLDTLVKKRLNVLL